MQNKNLLPEHTAVRVSLWRALHVLLDTPPFVLNDTIGEQLIAEANWMDRPDMHPVGSRKVRASIVGRARFIEDLVEEQFKKGIGQYVILGAGIDTFAQRKTAFGDQLKIFEVDQASYQSWKIDRLQKLNYQIPDYLKFVPVDFEKDDWVLKLVEHGFDLSKPAIVVSTGVTMYLSLEANINTLKKMQTLATGSLFATTFMLPPELLPPDDRALLEFSMNKAAQSGTPFISLFKSEEILKLASDAGLKNAKTISSYEIIEKYFKNRSDQLVPAIGECFLVVTI